MPRNKTRQELGPSGPGEVKQVGLEQAKERVADPMCRGRFAS